MTIIAVYFPVDLLLSGKLIVANDSSPVSWFPPDHSGTRAAHLPGVQAPSVSMMCRDCESRARVLRAVLADLLSQSAAGRHRYQMSHVMMMF